MSHTHRPLFGVVEQVAKHEDKIRDVIKAGRSIALDGVYPTCREHGYYGAGKSGGETHLVCDLTRHTGAKPGRSLLIHKSGWPDRIFDEMHALLGQQEKLQSLSMPHSAFHRIREAAWYFEQRAWSQYALENHRRVNHWLMMWPNELRLLAALVDLLGNEYGESPTWFNNSGSEIDLDHLAAGMSTAQERQKKLVARAATLSQQSLMQFLDSFLLSLPEIVVDGKHALKVSGYTSRGRLVLNVEGKINDDVHYQQGDGQIIVNRAIPTSAATGMIGESLKEVIDLPWIGNEEKIADAYVENERLHLWIRERNDKAANGIVVGQVLPKKARPGTPLGWEKNGYSDLSVEIN